MLPLKSAAKSAVRRKRSGIVHYQSESNWQVPNKGCGLFGKGGVDENTGSQFKSRGGKQTGQDLQVPMEVVLVLILDRGGMDDVIKSGVVQTQVQLEEGRF